MWVELLLGTFTTNSLRLMEESTFELTGLNPATLLPAHSLLHFIIYINLYNY
jgi:hypothetical protein